MPAKIQTALDKHHHITVLPGSQEAMIQVEFTDLSAGRWGFNATVKFSLPPNKPNPGGNLILEVSMKTEILDCDDKKLRDGSATFNYGPLIENFGPFTGANPIYDFHRAMGRALIDETYGKNEKIRITITGKVWLQDVKDAPTRGEEDAYKMTTPPQDNTPKASQKVPTGKKWTKPGIIKGLKPEDSKGSLEGEPKTPKTSYTFFYTWSKCGEEATWSGSTQQQILIPIAVLIPGPEDEYYASYAPGEKSELDKLTASLAEGETSLLNIETISSYEALASLPNASIKLAARLKKATPTETLILTSLATDQTGKELFTALAAAMKRHAKQNVFISSHGGGEAWNVADFIDAKLRDVARTRGLRPPAGANPGAWLKLATKLSN